MTHEGWSNRETWAANLWIQNEYTSYRHAREMMRAAVDDAITAFEQGDLLGEHPANEAARRAIVRVAVSDLARALEDAFCPIRGDAAYGTEHPAGLAGDLLLFAAAHIDWHEIAAAMLTDVTLVPDADGDPTFTVEM